MMIQLLWFIFLAAFIIQAWYVFVWLNKASEASIESNHFKTKNPGVSVVICARNALTYLKTNLNSVLEQEYSDFEIILVDDGSTDGSGEYLKRLVQEWPHLKVLFIDPNNQHPGKKVALHMGISEASHDWILLTDADCVPASKKWVSGMISEIDDKTSFVLGISPAIKRKGFLNRLVRFDHLHTAIQYVNMAFSGKPYMGVGRNLLVRRKLFFEPEYKRHLDLSAGDDDLLVNQFCNEKNTKVCINRSTYVYTEAKQKWIEYFRQKRRHYSVSHRYQRSHVYLLLGWNVSKVFYYLSAFALIVMSQYQLTVIAILFIHFLNIVYLYRRNTKVLENSELVHLSPVLDVISVFFNSFVLVSRLISRKVEWK